MSDRSNPWVPLSSRRIYESPYLDLDEDQVRHRSGKVHPYTAVRFRVHGIAVLPLLSDGSTYLVGQYRYLSDRFTWELPRGGADRQKSAEDEARRELQEEVGLEGGSWLELLRLLVSPGITDEWAPCFVAWNLDEGTASPDEQEDLILRKVTLQQAVQAALDGTIVDAASVATLLALHQRYHLGALPADLLALLRRAHDLPGPPDA